MDFIDYIKQHSARTLKQKGNCGTEEATKQALILPFFHMLGWDIFNPEEFIPEFTADVGIKKGEKVDYAIAVGGQPTVLIECKWSGAPLDRHDSQLFRYFGTTTAKFAILTNGLVYKFYTDLDEPNKMDLTPFLEIDLSNLNETLVPEVKKFHKDSFDPESLATVASELKYSKAIKEYFKGQLAEPGDDFVRYFAGQVYDGVKTQAVMERFTGIVRTSLNDFIAERLNDRLKKALGDGAVQVKADDPSQEASPKNEPSEEPDEAANKIVTTQEELEALYIIKGLLRSVIPPECISYKDTQRYFSVIADDMITHWVARLTLGEGRKSIQIPDSEKKAQKYQIESIDDIYGLQEQLLVAAQLYA